MLSDGHWLSVSVLKSHFCYFVSLCQAMTNWPMSIQLKENFCVWWLIFECFCQLPYLQFDYLLNTRFKNDEWWIRIDISDKCQKHSWKLVRICLSELLLFLNSINQGYVTVSLCLVWPKFIIPAISVYLHQYISNSNFSRVPHRDAKGCFETIWI